MLLPDVHGTNGSGYVDGAGRPGVDNISFIRGNYDSLLGLFFQPITNQFTDTYVSTNALLQQQLERVIDEPDFVFSAADFGDASPVELVLHTGTSNWWSGPYPPYLPPGWTRAPGVIRPPVRITFNKAAPLVQVQTSDEWLEGIVSVFTSRWGTFDASANPPIVYPEGTQPNPSSIHLRLKTAGSASTKEFTWQLPLVMGEQVALQTSTNVIDWTTLTVVTNRGASVQWDHTRSRSQRFFRVVPE